MTPTDHRPEFDRLAAKAQQIKQLLRAEREKARAAVLAEFEALVGAGVWRTLLQSAAATERALGGPQPAVRRCALYLAVKHWGFGGRYAGLCEQRAREDPDTGVREEAAYLLEELRTRGDEILRAIDADPLLLKRQSGSLVLANAGPMLFTPQHPHQLYAKGIVYRRNPFELVSLPLVKIYNLGERDVSVADLVGVAAGAASAILEECVFHRTKILHVPGPGEQA